jgi:hypothetical protein
VTFSIGAAGPPVTAAALEDADEQISQLIRTLQQKPLSDERISRIFQQAQRTGAAAATAVSTAGGGQAGSPVVNAANLLKASLLAKAGGGIFGENAAASPAMPVLTPQVALSPLPAEEPTSAAGFQNSYLDSLARSQITDKRSVSSARPRHLSSSSSSPASVVTGGVLQTTAAAAGSRSFHQQQQQPPLLSPTGGLGGSAPRLSAAFAAASPTILQGKVSVPTVIQQNPRFDVAAAPHQAAAPITLQTVSSGVGGVGSQIRAMQQHVQPNTRLMRGPNGQVTVQKVQTIELSQENQQVRNSVPNK